jgi:hypothetical protein
MALSSQRLNIKSMYKVKSSKDNKRYKIKLDTKIDFQDKLVIILAKGMI